MKSYSTLLEVPGVIYKNATLLRKDEGGWTIRQASLPEAASHQQPMMTMPCPFVKVYVHVLCEPFASQSG